MVEIDKTFVGREPGKVVTRGGLHRLKVLALVNSDTGYSRAVVVDNLRPVELMPVMYANVAHKAQLMMDEGPHYSAFTLRSGGHKTANHSKGE